MKNIIIISLLFLGLTSCSSIDNKTIGNTLGAAAGGVVGAQFGAGTGKLFMTAIGAGLGALVGGEIADELTKDKVKKKCEELGFEENTSEFQNCLNKLKWEFWLLGVVNDQNILDSVSQKKT